MYACTVRVRTVKMERIHNRTVVCGLRESPARASCRCTWLAPGVLVRVQSEQVDISSLLIHNIPSLELQPHTTWALPSPILSQLPQKN
jgi:hypothetical protein